MPITDKQVSDALDAWWMICGLTMVSDGQRDHALKRMRRCLENFEQEHRSADEIISTLQRLDECMNNGADRPGDQL